MVGSEVGFNRGKDSPYASTFQHIHALSLTTQDTQVDVQQNPEIYAHRIRENLDRDCAHVHAILIRGETTVRSVLRNRFYIPRLHTTRTGYQICTEKGS